MWLTGAGNEGELVGLAATVGVLVFASPAGGVLPTTGLDPA